MLHRRKSQCLDLPPKRRRFHPVRLEEAAALRFQQELERRITAYRARAARGEVRRDAEALALLTALRQIGAHHKLPAAAALVNHLLERGESVVVFTGFVAPARFLHRHLGGEERGVLLTGAVPAALRQPRVDAFQAGARTLLVATYGTAGLGFTLHRARHVVLIDRPWTPGDTEQAEDRCHRIGMGSALTSHWMQLGVADRLVDELIASKEARIAELMESSAHRWARAQLSARMARLVAET